MAIEWDETKVLAKVEEQMRRRLAAAAMVVASHAKVLLSRSGVMTAGAVRNRANRDAAFVAQFNRNAAFRTRKGNLEYLRLAPRKSKAGATEFDLVRDRPPWLKFAKKAKPARRRRP